MSRWDASSAGPPAPVSALDPRSELVSVALSASVTAAVESSGQVVRWPAGAGAGKHLPGLNGINIVDIAVGESFYCLLTDRGILLTLGQGAAGCLGHGDTLDLASPRIVEALLGDDITRLAAGPRHVAVVSGDGELFTWGESGGAYNIYRYIHRYISISIWDICAGWLAQGTGRGKLVTTPELVDTDEDVETVRRSCVTLPPPSPSPQVVCGLSASAVLAPDGRLLVAGDNTDNRLGLDTETRCR